MSQRNVEEDEFLDKLWALVKEWRTLCVYSQNNDEMRGSHAGYNAAADELEAVLGGEDSGGASGPLGMSESGFAGTDEGVET